MTTPVFLVGARRSGTTLFRLMLDGHPQMVFQHRWEVVADAIAALEKPGAGPETLHLEEIGKIRAASLDELKTQIGAGAGAVLARRNKTRIGATCHVGFLQLPKLWPAAKFIHLLRDPRDVAISFQKLGWVGHAYFAGDAWVQAERDWDGLVPQLSPGQYLETRYEDMVADPEHELTRICDFLGIDYSAQLFDYTKTSSYSYPKKELANRWKAQLSPRDLRLVEARMRPLMSERGYAPLSPPTPVSPLQVRLFGLQNIWRRRVRRLRENGPYFVLINMLARALNWPVLTRLAQRAQDDKRSKHISSLEKGY